MQTMCAARVCSSCGRRSRFRRHIDVASEIRAWQIARRSLAGCMPQQLSLFEEPKHESQDYPLFFALLPDEEATLQIAQLVERFRQSHGLTGALRPLHVTLCDLVPRETPQRTIEVASKVAASVAAAPFRVALNRMTRFGGK